MFETLSQAQMIFLGSFMFMTLFASVKILSLVAVSAWTLTAISLIGVMEFGLEIQYFWFMAMILVVAIAVGMSVKTLYHTKF